ncbi:DMT family transporter [Fodinibius salsisoli]|uniref:DMT family transporter n=1 Tax=Fodinibius salsisoli TaxID=2820877 RepID=A0ABT3PMA1_9BACT|nr:DMT family transporter [Fodinibius salsisoli]
MLFTFIWGANFILAELALQEMAPISFSVSRFAVGGMAMLLIMYCKYRSDCRRNGGPIPFIPSIKKEHWPRLLLISFIGATLAPWLGIEGLGLTHGARASLWLALGPAISTVWGYLFGTERMGQFGYAGVILAVAGTIILAWDGIRPNQGYWLGDLILIIALILTVIELHLIKPLAREYGSIPIVTIRTAIGCSLYLLIASPALIQEAWLSLGFWTWIAIIAGGGIGVGMGQWIKVRALKKLGPTQVVLYGNLVPIAALLIAWLSIGENPSFLEIVSALFIISGAIFIQVIDARKSRDLESQKRLEEDLSMVASTKQDN